MHARANQRICGSPGSASKNARNVARAASSLQEPQGCLSFNHSSQASHCSLPLAKHAEDVIEDPALQRPALELGQVQHSVLVAVELAERAADQAFQQLLPAQLGEGGVLLRFPTSSSSSAAPTVAGSSSTTSGKWRC